MSHSVLDAQVTRLPPEFDDTVTGNEVAPAVVGSTAKFSAAGSARSCATAGPHPASHGWTHAADTG